MEELLSAWGYEDLIESFKECPSTYYIPAIPKRHSNVGKPILAKGRLVDKVRNLLHRSGEGSQLRKKKGAEDLPSADAKRRTVECSNEDAERACLWLKNRQEPWDEVIENWTKTHDFRHCDKNAKTVADFLKQWPILNSQSSQGLIDIDFDLLYPNCGLKLVTNWKHFFETVKRLRHKNIRDETPLLLLNHLQELGEDHCDNIEAVQLYLLSYMIPPKGRLCLENKKHWKFSSQESCDSLIIHAKNCGDIERLMNAQKEKAKAKKLTLQPYVLIEGLTLWEISNCYIVIDDLKYQVPTAMKAIDLCFKVFHVFHAKYPPQSDHIWTLIQKESDCKRSFHRRGVFKKHLYKEHSYILKSKNISKKTLHFSETDVNSPSSTNDLTNSPSSSDHKQEPQYDSSVHIFDNVNASDLVNKLETILKKSAEDLVSKLYNNLSLTRSTVDTVIQYFIAFLNSGVFNIANELICNLNKQPDSKLSNTLHSPVLNIFEKIENCFSFLSTEYKRFKYFNSCGKFIKPIQCPIGTSTEESRKQGTVSLILKERFSVFIPMRAVLKEFLELPSVLDKILDYQNSLVSTKTNEDCMLNIVQGDLCKDLRSDKNKIILPIILYFDDLEVCNPLGSHAGYYKLGSVYYTIATIPPEFSRRLENIFVAQIFHSNDRTQFGNSKVFNCIIDELLFLQNNGIQVSKSDKSLTQVHFTLVLIIGDNLGVHSLLGCSESFSATYYCRFCTGEKSELKVQTSENLAYLRLEPDYANHLENKLFGIKETCIWHSLKSFHIYRNMTCDIMHDLFEGVRRYDMAHIVSALIASNFFSLSTLNSKIKYFSYHNDEKNLPPNIKQEHLNNGSIVSSAAEMLTLVRNFRFIIGDFVPEGNEIWDFYLKLLDITDLLTSQTISSGDADYLKCLITEHHEMYLSLLEDNLKPKHHFLLHYHRILKLVGPLCHISSMRFEAKHRDLKTNSNNVRSRKNLPLTLALRIQLKNCYRFLSGTGLSNIITYGSVYEEIFDFSEHKVDELKDNVFFVPWYEKNGIKFKLKDVIVESNIDTDIPQFSEISQIMIDVNNSEKCYFVCKKLFIIKYSLHYKAYKINCSSDKSIICLADTMSLFPTKIHTLSTGELYVSTPKM
ncbi:unnamed protein product [Ceutorhynchus assimilis]|uniref:Uncharacterized protein n=1 Tax=Ceutorhynchus assimilis TaxID=467358 RepID=A0A9N9QMY4_9CUCU|nr:unnamed protein product [Ceutorhynchus assimilis]